jgi:hypothetical protein
MLQAPHRSHVSQSPSSTHTAPLSPHTKPFASLTTPSFVQCCPLYAYGCSGCKRAGRAAAASSLAQRSAPAAVGPKRCMRMHTEHRNDTSPLATSTRGAEPRAGAAHSRGARGAGGACSGGRPASAAGAAHALQCLPPSSLLRILPPAAAMARQHDAVRCGAGGPAGLPRGAHAGRPGARPRRCTAGCLPALTR